MRLFLHLPGEGTEHSMSISCRAPEVENKPKGAGAGHSGLGNVRRKLYLQASMNLSRRFLVVRYVKDCIKVAVRLQALEGLELVPAAKGWLHLLYLHLLYTDFDCNGEVQQRDRLRTVLHLVGQAILWRPWMARLEIHVSQPRERTSALQSCKRRLGYNKRRPSTLNMLESRQSRPGAMLQANFKNSRCET